MFEKIRGQKFKCILADPPWRFSTWSETNQKKSASNHYGLMTTDDIACMPVSDHADDDSILFLWAINPMLPDALKLIESWGFTYKTIAFTWAKTSKSAQATWAPKYHMGLGYWARANSEMCLLATRGKPKRLSRGVRSLIVSPLREHSRKPEESYSAIEALCAGPRLELFGRTQRQGWVVVGNQSEHFNG